MSFNPNIQPGDILLNHDLTDIFKCSPQGGMRKSNTTNSLVIVSNRINSIYQDRWDDENNIIYYTGMGSTGDQTLGTQNKTVAESHSNGITIYLFEVYKDKEYTFIGEVHLIGEPFQEKQPDIDGNERLVWVFPLQIVGSKPLINSSTYNNIALVKEKIAKKLSLQELKKRAKYGSKEPGTRQTTTKQYERSPWVVEYAKRRANGICQLCNNPAPFKNGKDEPYLETHHIVWLADGGEDTIENTVALCPNCHRKMHIVNSREDKELLMNKIL